MKYSDWNNERELMKNEAKTQAFPKEESIVVHDAKLFSKMFSSCHMTLYGNSFCGSLSCESVMRTVLEERVKNAEAEIASATEKWQNGVQALAYTGVYDFGHTEPDWKNILSFGFIGLLEREKKCLQQRNLDEKQKIFYKSGIEVLTAVTKLCERLSKEALEQGFIDMGTGFAALSKRAPETLFEAMQLMIFFYVLQQDCEWTHLRSMGRVPELLFPYYENDIKEGRLDPKGAEELVDMFLKDIDLRHHGNNIPFIIGGIKEDGTPRVNELSYIFLKRFTALRLEGVKLHFLYDKRMPEDLVRMALDGIRNDSNSIVFIGDSTAKEALRNIGISRDDAENYTVVGCYETCGAGEIGCTCNAVVNLPKVLESVLTGGYDILTGKMIGKGQNPEAASFEEFFDMYLSELEYFLNGAAELTEEWEKRYNKLHSSPIFSSTFDTCVAKGKDAYTDSGAKYNNSSLNIIGIATVTDSLSVIKELVFEERRMSLCEFVKMIRNNFKGYEDVHTEIIKKYPHYGTNNCDVDSLAERIVRKSAAYINGRKNARGGVWRLGAFSIDWRIDYGKATAASADGRYEGAPLSKNLSASIGADIRGIMGEVLSAAKLGGSLTPNGSVLDLLVHTSAAQGEEGLAALMATLNTFMSRGGYAIHYNVTNAEILRDAKKHPEKYPNLQVRLCGWNVLWSKLAPIEQDDFIRQAEAKS